MKAFLLWITGLSASGKTTLAQKVYEDLKPQIPTLLILDGDNFREILGNDLGHDLKGRIENARRISRMCKFLVDQGISVVCSTMSLYKEIHDYNRSNFENYCEVFLEVDKDELIQRDPKGLYSKALRGEIKNVVGVDLFFDYPEGCHLHLDNTKKESFNQSVESITDYIRSNYLNK